MSAISWDQSIRSFIQQAGSSKPTPGGGSVAALVAALGASMTSMVGNLSTGEKFAEHEPLMTDVLQKMTDLSSVCEQLLADDIRSFDTYMEALKLPKSTDEEKRLRQQTIGQATTAAVEVPLRLMDVCSQAMQHTCSIAEACNKNVISDLGIGAILFEAAAQSALLTVDINLASMKDSDAKHGYAEQAARCMQHIQNARSEVLETVQRRIRGQS
ncbi:cyclodeaminase/cyclohydrolase family protein [Paenibacillus doosanensis]|uniref:cyclodeaminase/cyclohydrolase family protein n=1 Tax=Paenibacillus doosanensis TaxID=1229154 RepID=UPI0021808A7F|nr:cyclodeaminase/cyclohydrolase family protein [Paenibacillus doosanensis]MCS7464802.1 cyclodeaminase/cyclohydrolase family protein [Paenibacillus doosanensis]